MNIPLVSLSLVGILSAGVASQDPIPLHGTYRIGAFGSSYNTTCPSGPEFLSSFATITFGASGIWSMSIFDWDVCPGGTASSFPTMLNGSYSTDIDGFLDIDPGGSLEISEFALRPDLDIAIGSRNATGFEPVVVVAMRDSSGTTLATMNGRYHITRFAVDNGSTSGPTDRTDLGIITFDGAGGWAESGERTVVNGATAVTTPYSDSGTYGINSVGTLGFFNGGLIENGVVSPDGDVFCWQIGQDGSSETGLAVGVRESVSADASSFDGSWSLASMSIEYGDPSGPRLSTQFGELDNESLGASSGFGALASLDIDDFAFGSQASFDTPVFSYAVDPDGALLVTSPFGDPVLEGAVSADGTFMIGTVARQQDSPSLFLAIRRAKWPLSFGTGTPGTGGVAPRMFGSGGFPALGSVGFTIEVADGLPNTPALLAISLGRTTGLPLLGGSLWIDPGAFIVQVPITLSSGGSFPLNLPLASGSSLGGVELFAQTFVLDAGAPAGLSMSPGLGFQIVR